MHYKIVKSDRYDASQNESLRCIEDKVNAEIEKGFTPLGGICVDANENGQFYYQALFNFQALAADLEQQE